MLNDLKRSHWLLRKRTPSEPMQNDNIYQFHEGDLFDPGTGNFALDYFQTLPLQTIWGFGVLRTPNTFRPIPEPPLVALPTVLTNGLGGLQAGQMIFQPLIEQGGG